MLLWTVVPEEIVMGGLEDPRNFRQVQYRDKDVMVEQGENGRGRVVRLFSTDPADYLRPEFVPGTEIKMP